MALTKAEMAEHLFEKLGMNKRDAKDLVEAFFEEVREALESGEQVKLSGFGNFDLRLKSERPGRNPKTGEDIPIINPLTIYESADFLCLQFSLEQNYFYYVPISFECRY